MTVFVHKYFDVKLNFCCNELKFKLNWYICANTTEILKTFTVKKSVSIKSFHCSNHLRKISQKGLNLVSCYLVY